MKTDKFQKEWENLTEHFGLLTVTFYLQDFETYKMIITDVNYKDVFEEITLLEIELN